TVVILARARPRSGACAPDGRHHAIVVGWPEQVAVRGIGRRAGEARGRTVDGLGLARGAALDEDEVDALVVARCRAAQAAVGPLRTIVDAAGAALAGRRVALGQPGERPGVDVAGVGDDADAR